ncbi:2-dehydropantoate 2-reductase [Oleiphilus messinensis]|uniref:2-dehydropantoate 2-reductase n=1 Tax=Oleiphilus messinensis TaxID=141451 RepID=A0A1Y0IAX2_9GAMM|nr:2-dehydropantoate 2-reductase [Oleiphilus messinensis]ARU57621.1 2-dehydropantoate 2-reductase [Oleiphilus messinensis]
MEKIPHVHILGPGAIGLLWAAKLSKVTSVSVIPRTPTKTMSFLPILFEDQTGVQNLSIPIAELNSNEPFNTLLVTTKSYDTQSALESVRDQINENTRIVLFQNGMGSQQKTEARFPGHRIYCASTTEGANRPGKNHIVHAAQGETWVGHLNAPNLVPDNSLISLFNHAGLASHWSSVIAEKLWWKLCINCGINPFTVLLNCSNGEILDQDLFLSLINPLCAELAVLMSQNGIKTNADQIKTKIIAIARSTAQNKSSMLQDARAKRRTEIDFINGFVVDWAKHQGFKMPTNEYLTQRVRQLN